MAGSIREDLRRRAEQVAQRQSNADHDIRYLEAMLDRVAAARDRLDEEAEELVKVAKLLDAWPFKPFTVLALLAEIAALRDEHVHLVEQKEGAEDALFNALSRATEAERKLAEAVGLLREWMGTWFVDADSRGESAIADDTRKFLSKEAERG